MPRPSTNPKSVVDAVHRVALALETPNESDSNGESPATVTDGLFAIARALNRLAVAVESRDLRATLPEAARSPKGPARSIPPRGGPA
jgi:YbbR domain-containing protein